MPQRLSQEYVDLIVSQIEQIKQGDLDVTLLRDRLPYPEAFDTVDVFIAGSGPIG